MARPPTSILTDGEQAIMEIFWSQGDCSVRSVVDALQSDRKVAYTSVATMLSVLERKGHLVRVQGRKPITYRAVLSRSAARRLALRHLVERYFGRSSEAFAQFLVQGEGLDELQVDELERLIEEQTQRPIEVE